MTSPVAGIDPHQDSYTIGIIDLKLSFDISKSDDRIVSVLSENRQTKVVIP